MNYREEAYLMHYGIPGMKWGKRMAKGAISYAKAAGGSAIRKVKHPLISDEEFTKDMSKQKLPTMLRRTLVGSTTKEMNRVNKRIDAAVKEKAAQRKKENVKNLSDEELRKRINRIQMEKQYSELSSSKLGRGKRVVSKILENSIKTAVSAIVVSQTTKVIKSTLGL